MRVLLRVVTVVISLSVTLGAAGCSVLDPRVEQRWRAAKNPNLERDPNGKPTVPPVLPVVFIPGSKGSVLKRGDCDTGEVVWGNTGVVWLKNLAKLIIPLPASEGFAPERFDGGVRSCDILSDYGVRLFVPFLVTLEYPIYDGLMTVLRDAGGFDRDEKNVFYFHYDWRLDTRVAALELAARLEELRTQYYAKYLTAYCTAARLLPLADCRARLKETWPELFHGDEIKFNVVTHSLGGLVAGYLVRGLGRGSEIHSLVMIASPSEGAMFPLRMLFEGELALGHKVFHYYDEKETRPIAISFPSVFQALPRYAGALRRDDGKPPAADQRRLALVEDLPLDARSVRVWAGEGAALWFAALRFDDPSWRLICRADGRELGQDECGRRMRLHLAAELASSVGFQQTLVRGYCGTPDEDGAWIRHRKEFEDAQLEQAWAILGRIRPDLVRVRPRPQPAPCPAGGPIKDIKELTLQTAAIKARDARENPTALYQFFGHCDATPTFAIVSGEGPGTRLDFCDDRDPKESRCHDFGDQRIPRSSMEALWRHKHWLQTGAQPAEIVLCSDHVSVVKDATVQDNLLRILFGERVELAPLGGTSSK